MTYASFDEAAAGLAPAEILPTVPSGATVPGSPMGRSRWRLKVRHRLLVLVILLAVPMVGQTLIGMRNSDKVVAHQASISRSAPAALLLLNIDRDAYQAQLAAERAADLPAGDQRDAELADMAENAGQTASRFAEFEELLLGLDGEEEIITAFHASRDQWLAQLDVWLQTEDTDADAAAAALAGAQTTFGVMRDQIDLLDGLYEARTADELTELQARAETTKSTLAILLGIGISTSAVAGWLIARSISRSVSASTRSLEAASSAVHTAAANLGQANAGTVSQIEDVSSFTSAVSGSVATVGRVIDNLSLSIDEIAERTERASTVARDASARAQDTNTSVAQLGASSQEIGQVIEVITSIAKQTNLLALNATIEAARAGDSGKGFAVVANEVKELAKQTATATDQIASQIATIQTDTTRSVEAIEAITAVIEEISDIQSSIATAVEQQTSATSDIAHSVNQAVASTSSIAGTVATVADQARAIDPEIAATLAAAGQVKTIAADLRHLIG